MTSKLGKEINPSEFKVNPFRGFFIDIEGLDGSGQSTQIQLLSKTLDLKGIAPLVTKEPNEGCYLGKEIRQILKKEKEMESPLKLQEMFVDNRQDHLKRIIIPKLKNGGLVITDRYLWSNVAFGSIDLDKKWLLDLNKDFILPDLTIFIKVAPEICLVRITKEREGVELFEKEEKLKRVWKTYQWIVAKYGWTQIHLVDGEQEREKVTQDILQIILRQPKFKRLKKR
ncbi:dTMP kinase [Patescibacteria group bacterium]|nr:dTMP kinase [Patescibacteria group bacterium]